MNIELVGVADIDKVWPRVAGDITRCLRKAPMEINAGDIWTNCRSGQWLLIVAHDGKDVWGSTVWRFTANGYFECVVMGGRKMHVWAPLINDVVLNIATENGCKGLIATGRQGLISPLKQLNPSTKIVRNTYILEF